MKFMAFADLHGDFDTLHRLVGRAKREDIELIVCAGDLTIFEKDIRRILAELDKIGKPVLIIPGNHESYESMDFSNYDNLVNLHNEVWQKDGTVFLGWGTGGFGRISDELRETFRNWFSLNGKIVLVTHAPPYSTKLDMLGDIHIGNMDIRTIIKMLKPKIAISGHIHENEGQQDMIGETLVVNPGWRGMILEV